MYMHTPGPWATKGHGVIVGGVFFEYVNGCAQSQVALATMSREVDSESVRDANARLIAAAPELLELLRAALTVLPDSVGDFDRDAACYVIAKVAGTA